MSASHTRTAPAERVSPAAQQRREAADAARRTSIDATPQRFVTSSTPHAGSIEPESCIWQHASLENWWPYTSSAADSGERRSEPDLPAADGGEGSEGGSVLSGLMLERFDDDERWRELARTGRAL
jgi:hypothetical protein